MCAVLVFHAFPAVLPGGFVGVDVFFVISGYLISTLIWEALDADRFSLASFYARRVRRLFPALLVVLPACLLLGWWLFVPSAFESLGRDVAASAIFGSNVVFWHDAGYFTPAAGERALTHLWSLGVEEQFYLVYPWILLAARRSRRLTGSVLLVLLVASFAYNVATVESHSTQAFYLLPARFWELLVGGLLAFATAQPAVARLRVLPFQREIASFAGAGMLVFAFCYAIPVGRFPGWWATLPVGGAACLIGAGPAALLNRHLLALRAVVFVGLISYPLYLWHFPLLVFGRVYAGTQSISVVARLTILGLSGLLAAATYRFVELPIRRRTRRPARRPVALLLAALGTVGVVGLTFFALGGVPARFPATIRQVLTFKYDPTVPWRWGSCFLRPEQGPSAFKPDCVDAGKGRLVVVWGDSHAAHLYPGLASLRQQFGLRLGEFTAGDCPPILSYASSYRPHCHAINASVLERLGRLHPDLVILSAEWNNPQPEVATTVEALRAAGVRHIVLFGTTPVFDYPPQTLIARQAARHFDKSLPTWVPIPWYTPPNAEALRAEARTLGVRFVDALPIICPHGRCIALLGAHHERLAWFDESHLTTIGSRYLLRRIAPKLLADSS